MVSSENNLMGHNDASIKDVGQSPRGEAVIRRVEIACGLFETAFEIKSLELRRRNPDASDEWIRDEALRLIEAGCR